VCDEVIEIDALYRRVLDLLRRHDSWMPTGAVALALGVPLYAADRALEYCYLGREAEFQAGAGWRALPVEGPAAGDVDQLQLDEGGAS
jgi:hypothetical protein